MIYTLAVILVLVGTAASAIMVIAMWDAGWLGADGDSDNGQVKGRSVHRGRSEVIGARSERRD